MSSVYEFLVIDAAEWEHYASATVVIQLTNTSGLDRITNEPHIAITGKLEVTYDEFLCP